ncbi:quinone oxidoreductase family protein [Oceanobacillus sp. CF4.6]|uniref:quinone oxidoreductase family protein n=1 Tax=Oceanobacillus sp. CF4.6 TaxID=3373080 RepID=UPI003EE48C7B
MKSIHFEEYGESNQLKVIELDKKEPASNQVLIQVETIGINFADILRRRGAYLEPTPLPFIPGYEVAGVIQKTGSNSTFEVGDRVVALLLEGGGYSEYITTDEEKVTIIPDGISLEEAVAIPLQGLTAYYILNEMARIRKGETVLVHAAAGGVGTIAIQLAKLLGAGLVIATASTQEKLQHAKTLGADILINYTEDNWNEKVLEATNNKGVDIIMEMVGDDIFYKSIKCLDSFGRIIVYGRASRKETLFDPRKLMNKNQIVAGFFLGDWKDHQKNKEALELLFNFIKDKQLNISVGGIYPLEEVGKVHDLMERRKTQGKIILKTN